MKKYSKLYFFTPVRSDASIVLAFGAPAPNAAFQKSRVSSLRSPTGDVLVKTIEGSAQRLRRAILLRLEPEISLVETMHEFAVQGGWGAPLLRKHWG